MVVWFFLALPWVCLWFVIVAFTDHSLLPFLPLRKHVDSLFKPTDSTSVLEALPGKLDIKRYSPNFLYIPDKCAAEIPNQGTMSSANIKILSYNVNLCSPREWTNVGMYPQNCWSLKTYSKTCLKRPLSKRPKMGYQDQLSYNAGQKYCRMLQGEHSAILSTCIELPHGFKTFVLCIFELPLKTGFTVYSVYLTLTF